MSLELNIAWRYLRGRRGSRLLSFISVIAIGGVVVGVSALIVVMGVMNGLQRDMREKILIGTPDVRVTATGASSRIDDWQALLRKVQRVTGVVAAGPYVMTPALVNAGHEYIDGGIVVGLPPQDDREPSVTDIRRYATVGAFRFASSDTGGSGIVLGKLLAGRLGVDVGSRINLVGFGTAQVSAVTGQLAPVLVPFRVTGIFETGLYQYDDAFMYMALADAQQLAGLGTGVSGIEVKAQDRTEATALSDQLATMLAPYITIDWQQQNRSLFQALQLEKLGMGIILLLIVIVAAFNIIGTLTMVVAEKTKEIGILQAMGLTPGGIGRVFLSQGAIIGGVGTAFGLLGGLLLAYLIDASGIIRIDPAVYFIDRLPVHLELLDTVAVVLFSFLVAVVATLHPSRAAARLTPVEAIRHE